MVREAQDVSREALNVKRELLDARYASIDTRYERNYTMAKKILIVEDHEMSRVLLRDVLQHHGYEIIEAANGEEAIKEAGAHLPDLIFMDIQMPVMSGYAAIKALKSDDKTRHIKIVALTSLAMTGDKEKSLAARADYYITKPIDTVQLPIMVAEWLKETR